MLGNHFSGRAKHFTNKYQAVDKCLTITCLAGLQWYLGYVKQVQVLGCWQAKHQVLVRHLMEGRVKILISKVPSSSNISCDVSSPRKRRLASVLRYQAFGRARISVSRRMSYLNDAEPTSITAENRENIC